jgi:hypothetical protein
MYFFAIKRTANVTLARLKSMPAMDVMVVMDGMAIQDQQVQQDQVL